MVGMDYIFTDGQNSDFAVLCTQLDASLDKLAGHVVEAKRPILSAHRRLKVPAFWLVFERKARDMGGCGQHNAVQSLTYNNSTLTYRIEEFVNIGRTHQ